MNPLERAARALCELDNNPPGATMDGKPLWMDYLPEVRAVVEALREPSEEMKRAGCYPGFVPLPKDEAAEVWVEMIDALLGEGE